MTQAQVISKTQCFERLQAFVQARKLQHVCNTLTFEQQPLHVYTTKENREVLTYGEVPSADIVGLWTKPVAKRGSSYLFDPDISALSITIEAAREDPTASVSAIGVRMYEQVLGNLQDLFKEDGQLSLVTACHGRSSALHLIGKLGEKHQLAYFYTDRTVVNTLRRPEHPAKCLESLIHLRDHILGESSKRGASEKALFRTLNNASLITNAFNAVVFDVNYRDVFSTMSIAEIVQRSLEA